MARSKTTVDPHLLPSIRAQLMGIPDSTSSDTFHAWANLPARISREQFAHELRTNYDGIFQNFYTLKISRPETNRLLSDYFPPECQILGDDPRLGQGRGKTGAGYLCAGAGGREILREECLVFEDSVVGVEAGRRAGMRVVWVPHVDVVGEYWGRERFDYARYGIDVSS
ncbi:uncharacterized protein BO80DRAFT_458003 [Aspergillus ibericus CBS 121593]|uniref:HAD-like protein n=1 Tax=Aspergillus ibericus CBS 121593 TaxID=1448316 RepID=A0A395GQX8_9EURO|nr:hypothetical protein BO80DRAFT_458003 [Aspergillus ibericus CBS 121593]RAK97772.1 hypothetical protein BO80DRAFT_458003 [Aspergillus ibericus CBS 121593]